MALLTISNAKTIVTELEGGGWEAQDLYDGTTRRYKTAVNAQRAIKRKDKKRAEQGKATWREIQWMPITAVGLAVVKAVQEGE